MASGCSAECRWVSDSVCPASPPPFRGEGQLAVSCPLTALHPSSLYYRGRHRPSWLKEHRNSVIGAFCHRQLLIGATQCDVTSSAKDYLSACQVSMQGHFTVKCLARWMRGLQQSAHSELLRHYWPLLTAVLSLVEKKSWPPTVPSFQSSLWLPCWVVAGQKFSVSPNVSGKINCPSVRFSTVSRICRENLWLASATKQIFSKVCGQSDQSSDRESAGFCSLYSSSTK